MTANKGFSPLEPLTIENPRMVSFDETMVLFNLTLIKKTGSISLRKRERDLTLIKKTGSISLRKKEREREIDR